MVVCYQAWSRYRTRWSCITRLGWDTVLDGAWSGYRTGWSRITRRGRGTALDGRVLPDVVAGRLLGGGLGLLVVVGAVLVVRVRELARRLGPRVRDRARRLREIK